MRILKKRTIMKHFSKKVEDKGEGRDSEG